MVSGVTIKKNTAEIIPEKIIDSLNSYLYRPGNDEWKNYFQKVGNGAASGKGPRMREHFVQNPRAHFGQPWWSHT